jgi:DNA gyrase subunit A
MVVVAREDATLLVVSESGMGKRSEIDAYRLQSRGGKGVINLKTNEKTGKVVAIKSVIEEDQLMVITRNGVINRQRIDEIRVIGRATQGVRLVNLDKGDSVMDVARVFPENGSDGDIDGENEVDGEIKSGGEVDGEIEGGGEIESGGEDVLSEGGGEPGDEESD